MLQPKLLKKVLQLLSQNHIDYMVTGSLVSSMQGEPRATHDIDIVVNFSHKEIPILTNAFIAPDYYLSESAMQEAIERGTMFNILDTIEGDKVDFWMLTDSPFDKMRFSRKQDEEMLGLSLKVSSAEDTILMKLQWAKLSGGSEKQFRDALRVYEVQYGNLDMAYLELWVQQLQVDELWYRLKQEANPL